jgi:hypothetical protein
VQGKRKEWGESHSRREEQRKRMQKQKAKAAKKEQTGGKAADAKTLSSSPASRLRKRNRFSPCSLHPTLLSEPRRPWPFCYPLPFSLNRSNYSAMVVAGARMHCAVMQCSDPCARELLLTLLASLGGEAGRRGITPLTAPTDCPANYGRATVASTCLAGGDLIVTKQIITDYLYK